MRQKKSALFGFLASLLLAGCYTEPGETTAMGAATGGIFGAGLGALFGSQTGDPGTGLVLGGVAGTAAGAAIGNSFEADEQAYVRRDERIRRQEERLAAQRSELEALRRMSEDRDTRVARRSPQQEVSRNAMKRSVRPPVLPPSRVIQPRQPIETARSYDPPPHEDSPRVVQEGSRGGVAKAPGLIEREIREGRFDTSGEQARVPAPQTDSSLPPDDRMARLDSIEEAVSPSGEKREVSERAVEREPMPIAESGAKKPSSIFAPIQSNSLEVPADTKPEIDPDVAKLMGGEEPVESETIEPIEEAPVEVKKESKTVAKLKTEPSDEEESPSQQVEVKKPAEKVATTLKTHSSSKGECSQAEEEMGKAQNVSETADKLFHLRRALRLCPNNPAYHTALGDLYLSLKRQSDAEFEFQEALNVNPNYGPAREKLDQVKKSKK